MYLLFKLDFRDDFHDDFRDDFFLGENKLFLFPPQERRGGQCVRQVPRAGRHRLPVGRRPHPGRRPPRTRQRALGGREQLHGRNRAQVQVDREAIQ